jgi:hypothetical protein
MYHSSADQQMDGLCPCRLPHWSASVPTCASVSQVESSACSALTVSCGELGAPPPAVRNTLLIAPNNPEPAGNQRARTYQQSMLWMSLTLPVVQHTCCSPAAQRTLFAKCAAAGARAQRRQASASLCLRTCPFVADRVCFDFLLYKQNALLLLSTHLKGLQDSTQHTTAHLCHKPPDATGLNMT